MHSCRSPHWVSRFSAVVIFLVCMLKTRQVSQETKLSSQVLSPLTEGQNGAAALPPSLLESLLEVSSSQSFFLSSQPWYSVWKKNPLLRMWFLGHKAQSDIRKRWFFFYVSCTVVWIFFSAVPYMKLTITVHLNWHLLSVFSTSSWMNRCQWAIAVQ